MMSFERGFWLMATALAACGGGELGSAGSTGGAPGQTGGVGGVVHPTAPAGAGGALAAGSGGAAAGEAGLGGEVVVAGSGGAGASSGASGGAESGQAGAGSSGGMGPRRLERVLVYDYVDINPTTDKLRLHTGGGADERLLQELSSEHGFAVVVTDEASAFTPQNLASFDVVVFASPNYAGQRLDGPARVALEAFVRQGGGWLGWHYALWVEKDWPFMKELGGGRAVVSHGPGGTFERMRFDVSDQTHPVVRGLGNGFVTNNEDWLSYNGAFGPGVTVLATCDLELAEKPDWPVIWTSSVGQGRAFFTMLGHSPQAFALPEMKTLTWNALRWAARIEF